MSICNNQIKTSIIFIFPNSLKCVSVQSIPKVSHVPSLGFLLPLHCIFLTLLHRLNLEVPATLALKLYNTHLCPIFFFLPTVYTWFEMLHYVKR